MYDNVHDTLLAHHTYASHLFQRLDWVVSEYNDSSPWKIVYGKRGTDEKGLTPQEMSADDLVLYNAIDVRHTAKAWQRMQADLAPETATYNLDRRLSHLCRRMGAAGIGVDIERKKSLEAAIDERCNSLASEMRQLLRWPDFRPAAVADVRDALFDRLGVRAALTTPRGLPSTNNATLESLKPLANDAGRLSALLLDWRVASKIKGTYLVPVVPDAASRMHYNWKAFGTVSGRFSCRLQSCPRWSNKAPEERVREIYVPRIGNKFVYFDVSQGEMKAAAYLAADPTFVKACAGDIHANNAKNVWPEVAKRGWLDGDAKKDVARGKPYRDLAKNFGFAICYLAEAEKIFTTLLAAGFPVTFRQVEVLLARLRALYKVYYRYAAANLAFVQENGYLRTFRGRKRVFGWHPKPTDVANYPIQGFLADIMNERLLAIDDEARVRGIQLVAQVHDAATFDTPASEVGWLKDKISAVWDEPISLPGGELVLTVDLKEGERWSDF